MLSITPSVQSPTAWWNARDEADVLAKLTEAGILGELTGAGIAGKLTNALVRGVLSDVGYRFQIHPAETAAGLTVADLSLGYEPGNVMRYGADASGTNDATTAFNRAILVAAGTALVPGIGVAFAPAGTFLINGTASSDSKTTGVLLPFSAQNSQTRNVVLRGSGRSTVLKCGSNSMVLIRLSASNCAVRDFTLIPNGKTGCWALGVVAENMTQTTSRVDQNYNHVSGLWIEGTFDEGIVLSAGPDVAGADSGCWYNHFENIHVRQATRGVWLKAPNNAGGSPCNRNVFVGIRVGESMNTGLHIDSGDTNEFHSFRCEGVNTGTSPNATPTGIVIKGNTGSTESNRFFGGSYEACTRSVENENARSEFYGCAILTALWTAVPVCIIGGYDDSTTPKVMPGYVFQTNNQIAGYTSGALSLWNGQIEFPSTANPSTGANILDDYREGTWTPTLQGTTGVGTTTYSARTGHYTKIGRLVIARCSIAISATSGMTGDIVVNNLPFANGAFNSHASIGCYSGIDLSAGKSQLGGYVTSGQSYVILTENGDNTTFAHIQPAAVGASAVLELSIVYQAAN